MGVDTLTRSQQDLIAFYMRLRNPPWILLSEVDPLLEHLRTNTSASDPTPAEATKMPTKSQKSSSHIDYIRQHLQMRQPSKSFAERAGAGYEDYLQNPLQPLTQNLESVTYETFESCPVKYNWYEEAIANALTDWRSQGKPASAAAGKVIIAIVGAGRGPLVTRTIQASNKTGVPVDVWAIEKNPSAFIMLQRHNQRSWKGQVHLVQSDMRSWTGPSYGSSSSDNSAVPSEAATHPNASGTSRFFWRQ